MEEVERFWAVHKVTGEKWVPDEDYDECLIMYSDGSLGYTANDTFEHWFSDLTEYKLVHTFSESDIESHKHIVIDYNI